MRTAEPMTETEHIHRISENLMNHLAKGQGMGHAGGAGCSAKSGGRAG